MMKFRNGFVSNSSSSSFVVVFDKQPQSEEELRKIMFPNGVLEISVYGCKASTKEIAKQVFKDLTSQQFNDFNEVKNILSSQYLGDFESQLPDFVSNVSYSDNPDKYYDNYYKEEAIRSILSEKAMEKFINENKNCFIYVFNYGDEGGSFYALLEHGDIFSELKHIRISNH